MRIYPVRLNKTSQVAFKDYPLAPAEVDGRTVLQDVHNTSSIEASVPNAEVLPGIRELPMSDFELTGTHYSEEGSRRITELAERIQDSMEISPLIVVLEAQGPYILEGATRSDALYRLSAKSFPALVVVDLDNPPAGFVAKNNT